MMDSSTGMHAGQSSDPSVKLRGKPAAGAGEPGGSHTVPPEAALPPSCSVNPEVNSHQTPASWKSGAASVRKLMKKC